MPNTIATVHLPRALRDADSALVKLAGKVDSFSLALWRTPECQLKHQVEKEYHAMVFATRKEVRKHCPRYSYLPGEGILDFSTDCASGQPEPGDLGKPPQPKRGRLCQECCFFLGEPEVEVSEVTGNKTLEHLVPGSRLGTSGPISKISRNRSCPSTLPQPLSQ
jgi:hypothetical protein